MPDHTTRRRFTLVDLMALVATVATSFGILRASSYFGGQSPLRNIFTFAGQFGTSAFAILGPASAATFGLGLLRPRPPRRELLDRPGAVACIAATAAMPVCLTESAVRTWLNSIARAWRYIPRDEVIRQVLDAKAALLREILMVGGYRSVVMAGFGVALSWAMLAASGRWRSEPNWIDRTGRALGAAWITSAVYLILIDHD